jgi:hypothetical protein
VLAKALKAAAHAKQLPPLSDNAPLIAHTDASLRYAHAGAAVKELRDRSGLDAVLGLVEEVGAGAPFAETFERRMGLSLGEFEEKLRASLEKQ